MSIPNRLVDRLRGIYVLAVDPNIGPLDGKMTFTRDYSHIQMPTVQREAATLIEGLEAGETLEWRDIVDRLLEPCDPLGIGKLYVPPIQNEAVARIRELVGE